MQRSKPGRNAAFVRQIGAPEEFCLTPTARGAPKKPSKKTLLTWRHSLIACQSVCSEQEMKTHLPKVDLNLRKWHVIDANGAVLGRLAVQVANVLRGRHKPVYTP